MRACVSPPMWVVSLATHSPAGVTSRSFPPVPRSFVGFQGSAFPVRGPMAPIPGLSTAPGFFKFARHRWCPCTYTALSVTATECSVSPPGLLVSAAA